MQQATAPLQATAGLHLFLMVVLLWLLQGLHLALAVVLQAGQVAGSVHLVVLLPMQLLVLMLPLLVTMVLASNECSA
jgi:hypothetical protein